MGASRDDRRAGLVLVALAAAGLGVRLASHDGPAPGAVLYRGDHAGRPERDSLAEIAANLARPLAPGERIDIDRAPPEELTRLPRIGPALALRIIAERTARGPFGSLEQLDSVPGIGPLVLQGIRDHVSFSGKARKRTNSAGAMRVTLSTASVDELAQLPGIGPARARAIVENRRRNGPFKSVDALKRVNGIGPATIERIRRFVAP